MPEILPIRAQILYTPPTPEQVREALKRLPYPTDEAKAFVFPTTMATSELTDYATRLGASSLINFSRDAEAGAPYLINHDFEAGVFGYTFSGEYDPGANAARAMVYMLRGRVPGSRDGRTVNQEIADIEQGMRREVSVRFGGPMAEWRCDVCRNDVFSFDCPHIPGMREDGNLVTATVENARLVELSGVYRGACPGAIVEKAQAMCAQSRFTQQEFSGWCDRVHVANPNRTYFTPGNTADNPPVSSGKEPKSMNIREVMGNFAAQLSRRGLPLMAAKVIEFDEENLEKLGNELSAEVENEVNARIGKHELISALSAAEIKTPEALSTILREAEDGRAASAEANKALEVAAVRRFGQGDWSQYIQAYQHLPLAQRKEVAAQWEKDADEKFGTKPKQAAARQTAPTPLANHALDAEETEDALRAEVRANLRNTKKPAAAERNGGGK